MSSDVTSIMNVQPKMTRTDSATRAAFVILVSLSLWWFSFRNTSAMGACELRGGVTVGEPWSSLLLGGESNACIARSFDGTFSFFTFDPSVDVFVSGPMLADGGLYDHEVHAAFEDTLTRAKAVNNAQSTGLVVDAGANLGTLTLFASSRGCTVISFELQSRVVRMLEASICVNKFRNTVVRSNAVSDIAGKNVTYMDVPDNPGGVSVIFGSDANASRTVKTVTLDEEFPSPARIQFLKIDTEGHELPILRGAKSLFAEHRVESVVLELRAHQAKEAADFLYSNGYTCRIPAIEKTVGSALFPIFKMFPPGPPVSKEGFVQAIDQKRYSDPDKKHRIDFFLNPYCRAKW